MLVAIRVCEMEGGGGRGFVWGFVSGRRRKGIGWGVLGVGVGVLCVRMSGWVCVGCGFVGVCLGVGGWCFVD